MFEPSVTSPMLRHFAAVASLGAVTVEAYVTPMAIKAGGGASLPVAAVPITAGDEVFVPITAEDLERSVRRAPRRGPAGRPRRTQHRERERERTARRVERAVGWGRGAPRGECGRAGNIRRNEGIKRASRQWPWVFKKLVH
jgi:hypothetical protein